MEKKRVKQTEKETNKAGYTATSCGQVGRGGNARFHTFRLVLTDRRTDRQTDKGSYRVACPQLKTERKLPLISKHNPDECRNGPEKDD